jgi:hypothetical protein
VPTADTEASTVTATMTEAETETGKTPEKDPSRSEPPTPPPSRTDQQRPRADAQRPRDAWHERHPVIGVILAMVLFGVGGLAVSALVILCATFAVASG